MNEACHIYEWRRRRRREKKRKRRRARGVEKNKRV